MSYILHMSDFHLGKYPKMEEERLASLAKWINEEKIDIHYMIFTGDVLDARIITEECIFKIFHKHPDIFESIKISEIHEHVDELLERIKNSEESIMNEYNNSLREETKKRMNDAVILFKKFLDEINIPYNRFIACCGNHDRLRYLDTRESSFDCGNDFHFDEKLLYADYEPYTIFCNSLNNRLAYNTILYTDDNLNFVISNSNWRIPLQKETNNMCIHCSEVVRELKRLESQPSFQKNCNIFIAHKPFDDICEKAKFHYDSGQMLTAREIIERTTTMFLHGDKHSYAVKVNNRFSEFMCGLPLSYDGIHYNLIDYSKDCGVISVKYICFNKEQWTILPISECMEQAYDISKCYLKGLSIKLLCKDGEIPVSWDKAIEVLGTARENGRFDLMKRLFDSCSTFYNEQQEKIRYEDNNIFEHFACLTDAGSERYVFSIKGEPGTGKSTFLTLEYLYMFNKFYSGNYKYIPFYFDVDKLVNIIDSENNNIETIIDFCYEAFQDFLGRCLNISNQYKFPVCIIIDGLDTMNLSIYTGLTLEARIYQLLESKLKNTKSKYIMGLNTYSDLFLDVTFDQVKRFQYALFFNKVHIVPYKEAERHIDFLSAYLQLEGYTEEKDYLNYYSTLKKLRRIAVDLNFIYSNNSLLCEDALDADSWMVMRKQVKQMAIRVEESFDGLQLILYRAAFLLMITGEPYQYICEKDGMEDLTYIDFIKIRNNPEIAKFLIARYYVEELKKYARTDEQIPDTSILFCFIPRDLSVMIRLLIEELGIQYRIFERFIENHASEIHGFLYSTFVYLLGHNKKYGSIKLIKTVYSGINDSNNFFAFCNRRSHELAMIVSEENAHELSNSFIGSLMDNEEYRIFNRTYQLWYYQDIIEPESGKWQAWDVYKARKPGFDFHNCFMTLVSKLDYCFENDKPYSLMEIDMFTICDLIYSRLQKNSQKRELFYSAMYNRIENSVAVALLQRVCKILDIYFHKYGQNGQSRGLDNRIQIYFRYVKKKFCEISKKLEQRPDENVNKLFVSQAYDFNKIVQLCNQPRVGWNISKSGTVTINDRPKYAPNTITGMPKASWGECATVYETIGQHILECLYIAQMFLPENLSYEGYQKSTVISMLLMSEIGKVTIDGDYSPEYSNSGRHYEPHEKLGRQEFLILGAIDGYADLSKLYNTMTAIGTSLENCSDINMLICQEIKLIQMEYKYYLLYGELEFQSERHEAFKREFVDLKTSIGNEIRRMLIRENPDYMEYFL